MMNIIDRHCERSEAIPIMRLLRTLRVLAMTMILMAYCVTTCAQPVSSTDLINNAKEYDGRPVTYEGEVIGDIMARGEYAWLNVNDDVSAIGIWAPKGMLKDIIHKGTYNEKGDRIEIKGIFHRSCAEHGGDLDIHAENIIKIKDGYAISMPLDTVKVKYAVLFGIILVLVGIWKVYTKLSTR